MVTRATEDRERAPGAASAHRQRRWRKAAAVVALAFASAVAATELLLRLGGDASPGLQRLLYLPGEPRSWEQAGSLEALLAMAPFRLPPFARWGGFVMNRHGLATPEYATAKARGVWRVVALGDSFTFDSSFVPQEAMWHRLVGADLSQVRGQPVEVVNLGVPAVGPRFALRAFEVEGRRLAPDLVLFGLFLGNDLTDEAGARGSPLRRWSFTWRVIGNAWRSRTAGALMATMTVEPARAGQAVRDFRYDPEVVFLPPAELTRIRHEAAALFLEPEWPRVEALITHVAATVRALDSAVRAGGGRLVVAVMPDRVQADPEVRAATQASFEPNARFEFARPSRVLTDRLSAAGICAVDLLPTFRDGRDPARLWRRDDTHWSVAGNAAAAAALAAVLPGCLALAGALP